MKKILEYSCRTQMKTWEPGSKLLLDRNTQSYNDVIDVSASWSNLQI